MDWMNATNFAYMLVLLFTVMGTMVATKYRLVIKELKDVARTYHRASKDGKITENEREAIAKECMDVVMACVRLVWKF